MFALLLQGIVEGLYKGGAEAFNKVFATFLCSDNTFVIAPRGIETLDEGLISKINELMDAHDMKLLITNTCNFSDMEEREAAERFNQDMKGVLSGLNSPLSLQASSAILDVGLPELSSDSEDGIRILEALMGLPYIMNLRMVYKDTTVMILDGEKEATPEEKVQAKKYSKLCTGRPDRETIINDEDVMNVVIALGQAKSVEQFLELI